MELKLFWSFPPRTLENKRTIEPTNEEQGGPLFYFSPPHLPYFILSATVSSQRQKGRKETGITDS